MTRSKTSKAGRRQHRGVVHNDLLSVVDWVRKHCHPAFKDGLLPYQKSVAAALESGTVTIHMSSKFARSYEHTMATLADYQAAHDGAYPPSLYEILGDKPIDIFEHLDEDLARLRSETERATTRPIGAEDRWNKSQKDNPYAAPRREFINRRLGVPFVAGDDAGHSLPGWGKKP